MVKFIVSVLSRGIVVVVVCGSWCYGIVSVFSVVIMMRVMLVIMSGLVKVCGLNVVIMMMIVMMLFVNINC